MKTIWTALELYNSENEQIKNPSEYAIELLTEYKNTGSINGAFIADPETGEYDWNTAPAVADIDWANFPG
jgi:hypothetical protein